MKRRGYLATVAGTIALSGCSGSRPSQQAADTPGPKNTAQPGSSPTDAGQPAAFELVSIDAPEQAEIGANVSYAFTVKNTGEQAGTFETTISTRFGSSGMWSASDSPWRQEVPPGETVTLESQSFAWDYMERVDVRIDEVDRTFSIQFISKTLKFDESYKLPNGVSVGMNGVEFEESYGYSIGSYDYEATPSGGGKFAFVMAWASNGSGQPQYLPLQGDFAILSGSDQYDAALSQKQSGMYRGGEVQPGVMRDGEIHFEMPENLERVTYQSSIAGRSSRAT